MAANTLTLFCLVDGTPKSKAFPLSIPSTHTVGHLKKLIKIENALEFKDVDANDLTIWRATIPIDENVEDECIITLDALDDKTKLNNPRTSLSKLFPESPDDNTYIFVQPPPPAPKRDREDDVDLEYMPKNKRIRITEGWKPYKASNGESVDLPLSWIKFLESAKFQPEPRKAFDHLKSDLQAGDAIIIPSMGQSPKHFGLYSQGHTLFVTEQMLELWEDMRGDKDRSYRRVLSGPMGVGKSYLSYFLAARAYAEGWPILYISDAGDLDREKQEESAMEVVKRFLAINKDILTAAELEKLVGDYNGKYDISIDAISVIFDKLLKTQERKTLLLVDEHGKLFEHGPHVPVKFRSLNPLSSYHWWGEDASWSRVIFTGTAHAKYEMTILDDSYRPDSVLFVGPLSETVFLRLLDTYPRLNLPVIKDEVKKITNCVPRELVDMSAAVEHLQDPISLVHLQKWTESQTNGFLSIAKTYYESRSPFRKNDFYKALLQTFLGNISAVNFDWDFVDLGLIYRSKDKALLELFKTIPLPNDTRKRICDGSLSGDEFEQALFHQLICTSKPIVLNATDLNGKNPTVISLDFSHYDTIKTGKASLGRGYESYLTHASKGYHRFDFMLGPVFIRVSISDFASHNQSKTADIKKAFSRNPEEENQIERYLNEMYGLGHSAEIDNNNRFVVTRDGVPVPGFRIVYIRGSPGKPTHQVLVKTLPDVVHVTFEEIKEKLFKNIL